MAAARVTRRLVGLFVLLLFAGVALRGLGGLLLGMHLSGADPHSWSSLTPLRQWSGHVKAARGVIDAWQSYAQVETSGVANAWDVVQWGMVVDALLFAPLYTAGLYFFIKHTGQGTHRDAVGWARSRRSSPSPRTRSRTCSPSSSSASAGTGEAARRASPRRSGASGSPRGSSGSRRASP